MHKTKLIFSLFFFFLTISSLFSQSEPQELKLSDIWGSRKYYPKSPDELQPLNDGEHYCLMVDDTLFEYEFLTGNKTRWIFCTKDFVLPGMKEAVNILDFQFSADEKKVLVMSERENIYRHSFAASYSVFDIASRKLQVVSDGGKQELATLSPDGSKVAFVRGNNLFVKDLQTNQEKQITQDGALNSIINGKCDWVYEEEFSFSRAFDWSPDGTKIAFYRFDESRVKEFSMTKYGKLYPEEYKFKYPKAGEDNSLVTIHVYDITDGSKKSMDIGTETDQYIPRIKWTNTPNLLCVFRMNRLQNKLEYLFTDVVSGKSNVILTEENKKYIEINDDLYFSPDNKFFLLTSVKNGFRHIYLHGMDGRQIRQLTVGNWEVKEFLGYDVKKKAIFFYSNENGPLGQDAFVMNLDGTRKKRLTGKNGFNTVSFSKNFKYFVNTWQDINNPAVYTVCDIKGKELRVLENNQELKDNLAPFRHPPVEFFSFTTSEGVSLNGYMIKPVNFDPNKKYPVWMHLYGGPGSQSVVNRWGRSDYLWYRMLAQKGIISVCVDNRGTGGRGEEFEKCTYGQLGNLETIDQIEAAKYLGKLPYVDASRIGIWGWSYGGFMAAHCITRGADVFKAAIAVAPVTNWRYYDNIYTERYMGLPKDNAKGYDDNAPMAYAKNLKGKFLLVHGTADDNVHFQNSVELTTALLKENKQFDMFFYPNKDHGIYGGTTRLNLYLKMTDWILENL